MSISCCSAICWRIAAISCRRFALFPAVLRAVRDAGPRSVSHRRHGPDQAAHARADGDADRGNCGDCRCGRQIDTRNHPRQGHRFDHRQYRASLQRHQSLLQQLRHDRHTGYRDPDLSRTRITGQAANISTSCGRDCKQRFPGVEFFFQPADIVTQILNFGMPSAIDVQIYGNNYAESDAFRREM